jgi:NAD(P)-dependent dehydrogenase (short-subunit alcohol dehydrogenase family)
MFAHCRPDFKPGRREGVLNRQVVITGANRGIGLELVRQYARAGWRVLAGARHPEAALELSRLAGDSNGSISVHPLDVTQPAHIAGLQAVLGSDPLDLLICNAGVYGPTETVFGRVDETAWIETLRVNTIAPLKLLEALAENLARASHPLAAVLSSKMGSISDNRSGGSYIYRSSKAALNAVMRSAAIDLRPRGIGLILLNPGWVKTAMGGPNGEIDVTESVQGMRRILDRAALSDTGHFFDIDGSEIPW